MDHTTSRVREFDVDLETGAVVENNENEASVYINLLTPIEAENLVFFTPERVGCCKTVGSAEKKDGSNEKRKKSSNKKPPRPPHGPSIDAADQKLIRELAELAMLKRARIERMRALKKAKNCKASSPSSSQSYSSSWLYIKIYAFFTGMCPTVQSPGATVKGPPPESTRGLISVQNYPSSSVNYVNPPSDASQKWR